MRPFVKAKAWWWEAAAAAARVPRVNEACAFMFMLTKLFKKKFAAAAAIAACSHYRNIYRVIFYHQHTRPVFCISNTNTYLKYKIRIWKSILNTLHDKSI